MKVTNSGTQAANLMWQLNISGYPILAEHKFEPGTSDWITVASKKPEEQYELGADTLLYLSMYNTEKENLKIELKNISYKITTQVTSKGDVKNWLDESVPSIKDTYADIFDSFDCFLEKFKDILVFIDNIYRFIQAKAEIATELSNIINTDIYINF